MRFFYFILAFIAFVARICAAGSAIYLCDVDGLIFGVPAILIAAGWSTIWGLLMFWPEISSELNTPAQTGYRRTHYQYGREINGGKHFDFNVDFSNPLDPRVHGTPADTLR